MKWFKHYCDASRGTSLSLVHDKFGAEGMLAYFLLLECVASKFDPRDYPEGKEIFCFHEKILKENLRISRKKVGVFLEFFQTLHLLSFKKVGEIFEIEMPKLRSIMDNHSKNLQATNKRLASNLPLDKDKDKEKEKDIYSENKKSIGPSGPAVEKSTASISRMGFSHDAIQNLWNEKVADTGLPGCIGLSDKRKRAITKTSKTYLKTLEAWEQYFDQIKASKFCLGQNNYAWRADFDWAINPDSYLKFTEGKYRKESEKSVDDIIKELGLN